MTNGLQALNHVINDIESSEGTFFYDINKKGYVREVTEFLLDGGSRFAYSAAGTLKEQLGTKLKEGDLVDHYLGVLAIGDIKTVLPFLKLVKYEAEHKKSDNRYLVERVINALESNEELQGEVGQAINDLSQYISEEGQSKAKSAVCSVDLTRNTNDYLNMVKEGNTKAIPFLYALREQIRG